jgi:hypothetical protein
MSWMASSCLSRRFEMPMDGKRDSTEVKHALATASRFEFRQSAGCGEVLQPQGENEERCQADAACYIVGLVEGSYVERGCNNCHREQESAGQSGSII